MMGLSRLAIVILTFFLVTNANAQDWSFQVGGKVWVADYELTDNQFNETLESDVTYLWGVSGSGRSGKWLVGVNYLSGKFEFIDPLTIKRTEGDLFGAYYVHPQIGVIAGYKLYTFEDVDVEDLDYSGPVFGVTGYVPIGVGSIVAFATYTHVILTGDKDNDELSGPSVELGIGGSVAESSSLAYSLTYKYQRYDDDFDITHEIGGFAIGLNYRL